MGPQSNVQASDLGLSHCPESWSPPRCPGHPERPLEQYCDDCKLPMCWKCVVSCHGYHKTSKIVYLLETRAGEDDDGSYSSGKDTLQTTNTADKTLVPTSRLGPGVHLVQCLRHKDRCLEQYCMDCGIAMCWKCVVCCHQRHNTVVIGSASNGGVESDGIGVSVGCNLAELSLNNNRFSLKNDGSLRVCL